MDAMSISNAEMGLDLLDQIVLCPVPRDATLVKFCALSVVKKDTMLIIVVIATSPGIEEAMSG